LCLFSELRAQCKKKALETGLSIGAPLVVLEGRFFYRGLRKTVKQVSGNGAPLSMGGSARGTWMEGSFTEDPEGYVKNGSGNGRLSSRGPRWWTREGTLLYRRFSDKGGL